MEQQSTALDVSKVIIENLRAWHNDRQPVKYSDTLPHLNEAQTHQTSIGWNAFLCGFPSVKWKCLQQIHFNTIS